LRKIRSLKIVFHPSRLDPSHVQKLVDQAIQPANLLIRNIDELPRWTSLSLGHSELKLQRSDRSFKLMRRDRNEFITRSNRPAHLLNESSFQVDAVVHRPNELSDEITDENPDKENDLRAMSRRGTFEL